MPEALVPPELYYLLHLNPIAQGRAICQARRPRARAESDDLKSNCAADKLEFERLCCLIRDQLI
jgi:endonuclease III